MVNMGRIVGLIPPEPEEVKAEKVTSIEEIPAESAPEETVPAETEEGGAAEETAPSKPVKKSAKK